MSSRTQRLKKFLEVPKTEEDTYFENDRLTNRDIIPTPPSRRTWGWTHFATYWIVEGVSITGYTSCSALVGFGLSVKQAIACAVAAGVIYGIMAVVNGWMGSHHHVGFVAMSRAFYGMNGYYFALVIRTCSKTIWFAIQSYYGGIAVSVAISCMKPSFATWNTFAVTPAGNIASNDFVGMVIYLIIIIPCILIPPEKLSPFFRVTSAMVFCSIIGILIYAMKENNGPGTLLNQSSDLSTTGETAWAVVQGIFSMLGSYGSGISGQSDWTRYSKTKHAPVLSQLIGAPVAATFTGTIGALVTSAANDLMGSAIWNPIAFLRAVLIREEFSSKARAGVFFAAFGFVAQQLAINLLLNAVSAGMEIAGIFPKYMNIKRGSYLLVILCLGVCPWYLQANAIVVVIFGSGWGIFCSSITGITFTKYYFIYKRKFLISDLYKGDETSIYWFYKGFDWRAFVAWVIGTVFLLPGLAAQVNGKDWGFWNRIFRVSYGWGIVISSITLISLHYAFPHYDIEVDPSKDEMYTQEGDLIYPNETSDVDGTVESLKNGEHITTTTKEV